MHVGNGAARHTHDNSFVVWITFGGALVCLALDMHQGSEHMASALGVCLDVRESISCVGMQPSEWRRKCCKASRRGCIRVLHAKGTYAVLNFNGGDTIVRRVMSGETKRMPSNSQRKRSHI